MRATLLYPLSLLLLLAPACEKNLPCVEHTDEASCLAADCVFIEGGTVLADEDGCHRGESHGFCADIEGGSLAPSTFCTPGPDPKVVFFSIIPFGVPEDWYGCGCGTQNAPLAAACVNTFSGGDECPLLADHCATLTDPDSCNRFQGEVGYNGCLWVETTLETAADMTCSADPPVGRCIAVTLNAPDDTCPSGQPPASCSPADAAKHPYFARVDDIPAMQQIELVDDIPCAFTPRADFFPCWDSDTNLSGCECPCLP